jgi:hypothetical protein
VESGSPGSYLYWATSFPSILGKGSKWCCWEEHGTLISCVRWEVGLTAECQLMNPGGFRGGKSVVFSCELLFPFFPRLVISLFVDLKMALFLACYEILWVPFGGPLIFLPTNQQLVSFCWDLGMSTICHLAPLP